MIRTTSQVPNGHYRAGQFHSPKGSEWPDDRFTEEQLRQLRDDPRLTVEFADGAPGPSPLAGKEGANADDEVSAQWEEIGEAQADLTQREGRLAERAEALGDLEELKARGDELKAQVEELGALQARVKDPDFREAIARAAVARVMKAGNADDLTKDGKPKTEAVEAEFPGLEISAGDRDRFFEELQAPD